MITPKIPYPPVDGHKKSMYGVIKHLAKLGYQIDLVCYQQNEEKKIAESLAGLAKVNILNVHTPNSIWGVFFNLFSKIPYNLSKYKNNVLKKFLDDYFHSNKPDIVHIVNAHMGWVIDYLRTLTSAPIVLRQENLELLIMQKYSGNQKNPFLKFYSFIQYKKFIKYEPALCGKFDLCFMMSEEDKAKLLQPNPKAKCTVVPLGVDEELFHLEKVTPEPFSLFHIGSLNWYPNMDGILWFINEVFPQIVNRRPESKLYLYGGGVPKYFQVDEKIKSNVVIKGFVEDIWQEISNKQLAIVPLRIGGGIRVKILELLAVGHNIISTKIGAEGIPVENGKNIILADSKEEFIEKILLFFESQSSLLLNVAGRELIRENYSWNTIAQSLDTLYKNLIRK